MPFNFLAPVARILEISGDVFIEQIKQSEINIEMAQSHAHGGFVHGSSESASCGDYILHDGRRTARSVGNDRRGANHRPPYPDSRTALMAAPPFIPDVLFESSSGLVSLNAC